jgi:hypothetical protein
VPFFRNLSAENVREFHVLYEEDPLENMYVALDDELSHVVMHGDEIVAMLGVYDGVLWCMFSRSIKKHWRGFVRMSPKIIAFYHNFYDELDTVIWDQNTFVLNLMVHLGFEPKLIEEDERGYNTVHFVRCKDWDDGFDSGSSRPVMH